MMCFRDMTFCKEETCSKFDNGCKRALTKEVLEAANKWMKEPPISVYSARPECYEEGE